METTVDEIATDIYRLSTYIEPADFTFNVFLIDAEQPLLFHTGMKGIFPFVSEAVVKVMPLDRVRWISFSHFEADEAGATNDWLEAAPESQVAVGKIACMTSMNDFAIRSPRVLENEETIDLGGKRVRYLSTPHVPHNWDAGLLYEEITGTLMVSDLFTRMGKTTAATEEDVVGIALETEKIYQATPLTSQTAPMIRGLAGLEPETLAIMHGPAYEGDCQQALHDLANGFEENFKQQINQQY